MRYPDKFHIQPQIETRKGGDFIYEDDVTRQPFVFMGRIHMIKPQTKTLLQGDLTKATHYIHCGLIDFNIQVGMTVYNYSDEKDYEILLPEPGQRGFKLWVSIS